jgi:3-methyladenine DNA glycosylase AlkC
MHIPDRVLSRKAPRSMALVDPEAIYFLERGLICTTNLSEWLALNNENLVRAVFKNHVSKRALNEALSTAQSRATLGVNAVHRELGKWLCGITQSGEIDQEFRKTLYNSPSDVVKGWLAWSVGFEYEDQIELSIHHIKPFASDSHFSVRELAWMALRDTVESNPQLAIEHLLSWSRDEDENLRRYSSEVTRPRGVWCKHIDHFKRYPESAAVLLNNLADDSSRYVQNSVGNWLNDAGKTRADWVLEICRQWMNNNPQSSNTQYIVKRATRSFS